MNTTILVRPFWLALMAASGVASCSGGTTGGPGPSTPVVTTVIVGPAAPALTIGDTVRLSASPREADGDPIAGLTAGWASSSPSVASVTSAGLVTALTVGTTTITATVSGVPGQTIVTVSAGPVTAECGTPGTGWIFCDDFEQDRSAQYFERQTVNGSMARVAGVGRSGTFGLRARFIAAGTVDAGAWKVAFGLTPSAYVDPVDAGTTKYRDVYWRIYHRREPGWTGGGGNKLSRATSLVTANWAQSMIAHVWSGPAPGDLYLQADPASGTDATGNLMTTTYNDFNNFRWLGGDYTNTAIFTDATAGTWYCIETRVRLNDAGQSNGVFQIWIDGTLEAERTGLNWVGNYSAYGINTIFIENWWNNGATKAQERYFDNFVISTQRINC